MYFWPPLLLMIGLTLVLMFASGCTPHHRQSMAPAPSFEYSDDVATNERLENMRKDRFSTLRTEMVMQGLSIDNPMLIRAFKSEMKLELWIQSSYSPEYKLFRTYNICKKSGKLGPKIYEGDLQTPEGFYQVTPYRLNPNSKYFLSFNVGYPNEYDQSHGRTGSHIMIHGECVSEGCLAMTNEYIGEIYLIVENNFKYGHQSIPIHIYPFHMNDHNMRARRYSKWHSFWKELQPAYNYFESTKMPANITVENGHYIVNGGRYY